MENHIERIRKFNRFYTRIIGILNERYLGSPLSLSEGRVLLEILRHPRCNARDLMESLGLDRGYLSRILGRLERQKLITRRQDVKDRRARSLESTSTGQAQMRELDRRAQIQISELLEPLSIPETNRLLKAMTDIEYILDRKAD